MASGMASPSASFSRERERRLQWERPHRDGPGTRDNRTSSDVCLLGQSCFSRCVHLVPDISVAGQCIGLTEQSLIPTGHPGVLLSCRLSIGFCQTTMYINIICTLESMIPKARNSSSRLLHSTVDGIVAKQRARRRTP